VGRSQDELPRRGKLFVEKNFFTATVYALPHKGFITRFAPALTKAGQSGITNYPNYQP
jgi:hypothetical protein